MPANVGNWTSQNCTTVGTGNLILSTEAGPDLLKFSDTLTAGLVYYSIIDGNNRESGIGTFDGANTIVRTTVKTTKVGSVYFENGVPINLSGASIVGCTLNAKDYEITMHGVEALEADIGLRETAATGVVSGGLITLASPTTIDIALGDGEIVDGYTDRRVPTKIDITWAALLGFTVNMPLSTGVQVIYVDNAGVIQQKSNGLTPTERRTVVQLAIIYYRNGAIDKVTHAGILSNEVGNTLYDWLYFTPLSSRTTGIGINPVNSALSIWADSGELLSPGINIDVSITDQNTLTFIALGDPDREASFDVVFADGSVYLSNQIVIPEFYESAPGVATALTGNDAVIQYVYRTLANTLILQLGIPIYTTGKLARDSLEVNLAGFTQFVGSETTLLSAQVYVSNNSSDFTNSNSAGIVSLIGSGSNSSGGVAVSDFLSLSDVIPSTYIGQGGKFTRVTLTDSGIEFSESIIDSATTQVLVLTDTDITSNVDFIIAATKNFYLDGGGDTYIKESAPNEMQVVVGAVEATRFTVAGEHKNDNIGSFWGNVDDLGILHDGVNAIADVTLGAFMVRVGGVEAATFQADGIHHNDDISAFFGDGDALQIFNDGSNTRIHNRSGLLIFNQQVTSSEIHFQSYDSLDVAKAGIIVGGAVPAVKQYYNGLLQTETVVGAFNVVNKLQIGGVDVTVGAVDSGGAGFRVLRIPN